MVASLGAAEAGANSGNVGTVPTTGDRRPMLMLKPFQLEVQ
jgi:hypothetical protein